MRHVRIVLIVFIVLLSLLSAVGWAAPQDALDDPSIGIDREVSRTAIYLGDVFQYRISVLHANEFAFVTEELQDRLVVRPFELLDFQIEQTELGDDVLMELVLELVTYEDPGLLEIPSIDLFYYPRDALSEGAGAGQQDVPARAITVPAHPIHLQSTLLGEGDQLRDTTLLLRFSRSELIFPAFSGVLLLVLAVGGGVVGVRYAVQMRQVEGMTDQAMLQEEALRSIGALRQRGLSDPLDPALYLELSKRVREYLHSAYGLFAMALTPEEVRDTLGSNTPNGDFSDRVEHLLTACDRTFYDPETPAGSDFSELCQQAERIVKSTF
jgi:hypothetical protein